MKEGVHPDYHEITIVMTDGTGSAASMITTPLVSSWSNAVSVERPMGRSAVFMKPENQILSSATKEAFQ